MFLGYLRHLSPAAIGLLIIAAGAATAQTPPVIGPGGLTAQDILPLVETALPAAITSENSNLARLLLSPRMGPPLSKTFSLPKVSNKVFGATPPTFGPGCQNTGTNAGEADQGECDMHHNDPAGTGPFIGLSFSKNLGVGNIRIYKRPALNRNLQPGEIKPPPTDNTTVMNAATTFLSDTLGLPAVEFPLPPANAPNQFPFISDLAIGFPEGSGQASVPFQRIVHIPRGLLVSGLLVTDPTGAVVMPFVPAPGRAVIAIDSTGIVGALVEDWQELRPDPSLIPTNAKTRNDLVKEISQDLFQDGGGRIAHISAHLVYSSDWRGKFGFLVPAVQVIVTPIRGVVSPDDMKTILDQKIGTAGFVKHYALIKRPDFVSPPRALSTVPQ